MNAPVSGKVVARYGSKRGDGPTWKGVLFRAAEGAEVHAVAGGRVVYAEWMRGYGNLIIIDHGGQYLSLYGNNQALPPLAPSQTPWQELYRQLVGQLSTGG